MPGQHIALFLPDVTGGGAERMIVNLARGLAERGHRVDLVLTKAEGVYLDLIPETVRLIDLKAPQPMLSLGALNRYLRSERPVALMSALNQPNVIAAWAKRTSGVPVRVTIGIRNTLTQEAQNAHNLRLRLMPWFVKRFCKWVDAIVAVSGGVADDFAQLAQIPRDRVNVIYNPVVTDEMLQSARVRPDHPWFTEGELPVVLGVGRLAPQKDFTTLVRAFAKVRQQIPCRLMLLGEGPEEEQLHTLAKELGVDEDFATPGFVNPPFPYMGHAAVFVLSSKFEGLPGVLIQALAAGAPIVSTDCPSGPMEVLKGGKYGALVPVGAVDAMAVAIAGKLKAGRQPVPDEALQPFRMETVLGEYERVILGK